ncbi:MAG TPA: cytochrome o ubiquinol oxidase subunit IV [Candidatus Saccharimonadales bacterium]|nr:cytochrome o ubiquinol oxidase subunit IV [Candidatus Saccharimonadales bacterium]
MSKQLQPTSTTPKPHHGTLTSYVVGFVLSLLFTLVPYYAVVHKSFTQNTLLLAIMAFAVVQLVIQVVFFLHLGRERKPRFNLFFLVSTVGIIVFIVTASVWIMHNLHYNMMGTQVTDKIAADEAVHQVNGVQAGTCPAGTGTSYKIELKNDQPAPSHVDAHLCDTLIIVNLDDATRQINFGEHDHHGTYAGNPGEAIRPYRSMAFRLTEPGTYKFHDHLEDRITGDFTVSQ